MRGAILATNFIARLVECTHFVPILTEKYRRRVELNADYAELRKMRTAGRRTIEFEQATKQSLFNLALGNCCVMRLFNSFIIDQFVPSKKLTPDKIVHKILRV